MTTKTSEYSFLLAEENDIDIHSSKFTSRLQQFITKKKWRTPWHQIRRYETLYSCFKMTAITKYELSKWHWRNYFERNIKTVSVLTYIVWCCLIGWNRRAFEHKNNSLLIRNVSTDPQIVGPHLLKRRMLLLSHYPITGRCSGGHNFYFRM